MITKTEAISFLQDYLFMSSEKALNYLFESISIDGEEIALAKIEEMKKKEILCRHKTQIYPTTVNKGGKEVTVWRTYVKGTKGRRLIQRNTREALERELLKFYGVGATLSSIFEDWIDFRKNHTATSIGTIEDNISDWRTYYAGSELVSKPLKELTAVDVIKFFRELTKDRAYTKKRINNIKSVVSGMISFAVENGLCDTDVVEAARSSIKRMPCKQTSNKTDEVYSAEDVNTLLSYLHSLNSDDPYLYAIILMFNLFCRIGEVMAIKWSDIDYDNRTIYIHSQITESRDYINGEFRKKESHYEEHTKCHSDTGARYQYLTDDAIWVLEKMKDLSTGEFVFTVNGHFLLHNIVNRRLRTYCKECNIPYYSSHKIRFYNASSAYTPENLVRLSKVMGHRNTETTFKYIRNSLFQNSDISEMYSNIGYHEAGHAEVTQAK